jgi:hypothetical protein
MISKPKNAPLKIFTKEEWSEANVEIFDGEKRVFQKVFNDNEEIIINAPSEQGVYEIKIDNKYYDTLKVTKTTYYKLSESTKPKPNSAFENFG